MVQVPHAGPSISAAVAARLPTGQGQSPDSSHSHATTRSKLLPSVAGMANQPLSARRAEPLDLNSVERKGRQPAPSHAPPVRHHINGVTEAPTFRPTEQEWKEPIEYLQKIAPEGMQYGIVKIRPPDGWNPDLAIDTTVLRLSCPAMSRPPSSHTLTLPPAFSLQDAKARIEFRRRR